jgi:hypothetical protein
MAIQVHGGDWGRHVFVGAGNCQHAHKHGDHELRQLFHNFLSLSSFIYR